MWSNKRSTQAGRCTSVRNLAEHPEATAMTEDRFLFSCVLIRFCPPLLSLCHTASLLSLNLPPFHVTFAMEAARQNQQSHRINRASRPVKALSQFQAVAPRKTKHIWSSSTSQKDNPSKESFLVRRSLIVFCCDMKQTHYEWKLPDICSTVFLSSIYIHWLGSHTSLNKV